MRRLRHDDLAASRIIARSMIGPDHRHAGELALRAGHGRETDPLHAGDVLEHLLQLVHAGEKSLGLGRERMAPQEFRQHGVGIAGLGVVLHGAGAQGIKMRIDREVELRQTREVPHHLQLGDLGQRRRRPAAQMRGNSRRGRRLRAIAAAEIDSWPGGPACSVRISAARVKSDRP